MGGVVIQVADIWSVGLAAVLLGAFFAFFRFSTLGLAMRATALDQEAALAQGMSAKRVFAVVLGHLRRGGRPRRGHHRPGPERRSSPRCSSLALLAFPAIILGGLDSPGGAVLGGLIIGLTQTLTAGYQSEYAAFLGENFHTVMPFLVMVLILLVRPYGLFGTPEVKRI